MTSIALYDKSSVNLRKTFDKVKMELELLNT